MYIDLNNSMRKYRIVTECQGSWKWQKAYRIAQYIPFHRVRGKGWIWKAIKHSAKMSCPQLKRLGYWNSLGHGSLHNKPVRQMQVCDAKGRNIPMPEQVEQFRKANDY